MRLTDEQIRKIIWNIKVNQRVDQREKTFGWQANEAIAQAQYDQDMKEVEQAKQDTAWEIFEELENPCPFEGIKRLCSMCVVILKSQFIKEK